MDLKQLYQDIILEHGQSPRNFGKCEKYTHQAKGHNPLCGDQVQVYLKLNKEKKVENISFEGEGCAISMASASIMTETIKGKDFNVAKKILEHFLNMLKDGSKLSINSLSDDENTTMMSLSGVKRFPMRVKCATLAWHTFLHAAEDNNKIVNTEK